YEPEPSAGFALEVNRADMLRTAHAVGSCRCLVRIDLQPGDESCEIVGRHGFLRDDHERLHCQGRDWLEICQKIIRELIGNAVRSHCAPRTKGERVAIVRCARGPADPDAATCASHVFDHYRLAE